MEWMDRKVSGLICDRRLPARVKGKLYSSVVRPTMVYGFEMVAVTKKQVEEMEVVEIKMLRFAMGVTRKDKIKNEYIRGTVKILQFRNEDMYGHVMRRDQEYVGRNGVTGKKEKREAEEKILGCSKGGYGGSW